MPILTLGNAMLPKATPPRGGEPCVSAGVTDAGLSVRTGFSWIVFFVSWP